MSESSNVTVGAAADHIDATPQSIAVPPGVIEARRAFLRELPQLLKTSKGDWAAYTKDRRIACGPSKRELYRTCLEQGLKEGEFIVCSIEPDVPSEADAPVELS